MKNEESRIILTVPQHGGDGITVQVKDGIPRIDGALGGALRIPYSETTNFFTNAAVDQPDYVLLVEVVLLDTRTLQIRTGNRVTSDDQKPFALASGDTVLTLTMENGHPTLCPVLPSFAAPAVVDT
jgi:hypothetical protein